MLIPPSYLYPDAGNRPCSDRNQRREQEYWEHSGPAQSGRTFHGVDRALLTLIAVVGGILGYGGLMELVL